MNYDIIALALNHIAHASNFGRVTESLHRYTSDPTLEVPDYIGEHSKVLIQVGREQPVLFAKLMELVNQVRMGTGNPDLYDAEQWKAVDDALNALYERDRPTKLIDAIKVAASSNSPWWSALKSELKDFSPLVKLYRGAPSQFEDIIKMREYLRRDSLRQNLNARRKAIRERRSKLATLVQFKNKWYNTTLVASKVDELLGMAMTKRHEWVKNRSKGKTAVESSNEYWKLYDQQLDDALSIVERAGRGAAVIAKEIKYPRVIF